MAIFKAQQKSLLENLVHSVHLIIKEWQKFSQESSGTPSTPIFQVPTDFCISVNHGC